MMPGDLLSAGFDRVLSVVILRLSPFLVWACFSRHVPRRGKLAAIGAYGAVLLGVRHFVASTLLASVASGLLFYLAVSALIHRLPPLIRRGRITQGTVFVINWGAYLLLPALLTPDGVRGAFLVAGWDLALSGYSYCTEVSRTGRRPPLGDCLFFMLVNPLLVYSERGNDARPPRLTTARCARFVGGMLFLGASAAVLRPAARLLSDRAILAGWFPSATLGLVILGAVSFFAEYGSHSGLASMQISLMRAAGYSVPERYRYPFLAASPLDFWRRWNVYIGTWLRRYVFLPASRRFAAPRSPVWTGTVPLFLTFAASAALHDGYSYMRYSTTDWHFARFFSAIFVVTVAWSVCARAVARIGIATRAGVGAALSVAPRLCMLAVMIGVALQLV